MSKVGRHQQSNLGTFYHNSSILPADPHSDQLYVY